MDDIHAPTVASGPTSDPRSADEKYSKKLSLLDLIAQRDRVEGELKALGSVLDSVSLSFRSWPLAYDFPGVFLLTLFSTARGQHEH
jgi:26S proteasome non-ATPase regulatory subunit 9